MEAIERLIAERAALIARLSLIEALVAEHAALQQKVELLLSADSRKVPSARPSHTKSSGTPESATRRLTADVASFERAVRDILRVAQKPLDRNELYRICVERGIQVGGQEPLNTLASRMSRMVGVKNIRGMGYFLEDRLGELMPRVEAAQPETLQSIAETPGKSSDLSDFLGS